MPEFALFARKVLPICPPPSLPSLHHPPLPLTPHQTTLLPLLLVFFLLFVLLVRRRLSGIVATEANQALVILRAGGPEAALLLYGGLTRPFVPRGEPGQELDVLLKG